MSTELDQRVTWENYRSLLHLLLAKPMQLDEAGWARLELHQLVDAMELEVSADVPARTGLAVVRSFLVLRRPLSAVRRLERLVDDLCRRR